MMPLKEIEDKLWKQEPISNNDLGRAIKGSHEQLRDQMAEVKGIAQKALDQCLKTNGGLADVRKDVDGILQEKHDGQIYRKGEWAPVKKLGKFAVLFAPDVLFKTGAAALALIWGYHQTAVIQDTNSTTKEHTVQLAAAVDNAQLARQTAEENRAAILALARQSQASSDKQDARDSRQDKEDANSR